MDSHYRQPTPPPPLVALIAWVLPGGGYLLLGQRGRAMGVGITIILLFVMGLLIAGVRVIEVPGYDVATGRREMYPVVDPRSGRVVDRQWSLIVSPLNEIRDKPWSVPQVLTGPLAILAAMWSVFAANVDPNAAGQQVGSLSHARINEIGSLYLSVSGLLNLMAIIDSTWRASHLGQAKREAA